MILQFFGGVFLAEGRNLVKIHLQIMSHLPCEVILRCTHVAAPQTQCFLEKHWPALLLQQHCQLWHLCVNFLARCNFLLSTGHARELVYLICKCKAEGNLTHVRAASGGFLCHLTVHDLCNTLTCLFEVAAGHDLVFDTCKRRLCHWWLEDGGIGHEICNDIPCGSTAANGRGFGNESFTFARWVCFQCFGRRACFFGHWCHCG
mmetsp:Transcript_86237/g.165967  ORF Transcript_86237/g.165967 Transcript_86237/m.165967 type:complete len:204 (+) Transcript_86237:389-1000(+)